MKRPFSTALQNALLCEMLYYFFIFKNCITLYLIFQHNSIIYCFSPVITYRSAINLILLFILKKLPLQPERQFLQASLRPNYFTVSYCGSAIRWYSAQLHPAKSPRPANANHRLSGEKALYLQPILPHCLHPM